MYLSVTVVTSSHLCGCAQYLSLAGRRWVLPVLVNDPLGLLKGCSISQKADDLFTETNWCLQSWTKPVSDSNFLSTWLILLFICWFHLIAMPSNFKYFNPYLKIILPSESIVNQIDFDSL
uniref:Uncharacterized protein n=1 Tax=Aegilops tauschii subsp. strangulata TaxID=200361 RepID=A0A453FYQ6_AEGTS